MKLIKSATVWWGVNLDFYGEAKEQDVLKGKGDLLKNCGTIIVLSARPQSLFGGNSSILLEL